MIIEIPFHSFVDVITNSSTTIFVGCHNNTIKLAKDLIDELLKEIGSNKKADDLFEFSIVYDEDRFCDGISYHLSEYYYNEIIKIPQYKDFTAEQIDALEYKDRKKITKILYDKVSSGELGTENIEEKVLNGNEWDFDTRKLIIKSKVNNKLVINLSNKMQDIFDIEGVYNG